MMLFPYDRVLLVDDEVDFLTYLAKRLKARGFDVDTAEDGQVALEKAGARRFGVVVLDLKMPGIDGIEALEGLIEIDPDMRIILLSGHGSIPDAVSAVRHGAVDFLEKPAEFDVLLSKIEVAIKARLALARERDQQQVDDLMQRKGW